MTSLGTTFYGATSFTGDGLLNWNVSSVSNGLLNTFDFAISLENCTKRSIYDSWSNQLSDSILFEYRDWETLNCEVCNITTNQQLRDYVDQWVTNPSNHPCGAVIGDWDVGRVTDMSYVFCGSTWPSQCNAIRRDFNANISNWNTESVTDLAYTFWYANSFNGDLSNWNTSSVINMQSTFQGATSFTGDGLSNWDTSSVTNLYWAFESATSFNGDLSNWDTSRLASLFETFDATSFSGYGLWYWNVSQVYNSGEHILQMFSSAMAQRNVSMTHGPTKV